MDVLYFDVVVNYKNGEEAGMLKVAFAVLWVVSLIMVTLPVLAMWRKDISGPEGLALCGCLLISFVVAFFAIIVAILMAAMIPAIAMTVVATTIVVGLLALFNFSYRFKGWDIIMMSVFYSSMATSLVTFL